VNAVCPDVNVLFLGKITLTPLVVFLAGQRLQFAVEICDVRPATDQELDAARAEIDERIDSSVTIVYESDPDGAASYPRWSLGVPDVSESAPQNPDQLVPLRRHKEKEKP